MSSGELKSTVSSGELKRTQENTNIANMQHTLVIICDIWNKCKRLKTNELLWMKSLVPIMHER